MIRRTLAIAIKEMMHLRRDKRTTVTLLGMPVLLLLIFGFALSFDVEHIRLAVVDQDGSRASRQLREAFLESGYFDLIGSGSDPRVLDRLFDSGLAQAAGVIPAGYGRDLAAKRRVDVQFVLDGSDSQMATSVLTYAQQINLAVSPIVRVKGGKGPILPAPTVWYNPDLATSRFLVPGLIAFILAITSVIATALSVVREKERGTIESLRATPLFATELLIGKAGPYLVVAFVAAAGALSLAWAIFDVPVRGSLFWLAVITVLFLGCGLGWGIFISTIADTQQVAFQVGLLSSMLPTLLLSGFMFPISSMPAPLQVITHIVPARYYLVALREIVLKGAGIEVWWQEAVSLVVYGLAVLGLGTARMVRSL
ncbi:MAG: ABC transporter permease [Acidobacteria bacterium]|nr:ABC transporter permease [Acidobacteriota bacterium]